MAKTFGYHRQEIVYKQPSIEDILARWLTLFHMDEVCFYMLGASDITQSFMHKIVQLLEQEQQKTHFERRGT